MLVWLGSSGILMAQSLPKILALKRQVAYTTTDTSRNRLFYELGVQYEEIDHDSSRYFLTQSLQMAQRSHESQAIAKAMYRLGYLYAYYLNDNAKALEWLNKGIAVAKKNQDTLNLARCYEFVAAVAFYQNTINAEEIARQALVYAQKANDWVVLSDAYTILNMIISGTKNYKQLEFNTFQAMKACEKHSFDRWFTFGLVYCRLLNEQGKQQQAQQFYRKLNTVKHKSTPSLGYHNYLSNLADLAIGLRNYAEAQLLLEKEIKLEKAKAKPDTFRLVHVGLRLLGVYEHQRHYQQGYTFGKELTRMQMWLQDKRITRNNQIKLAQMKAAMDLDKKETQIATLATQQRQERLWLITAVLIALLAVAFAMILRRNQQRIQRQKTELTQLNATKDKLFAVLAHDLRSPIGNLHNNMTLTNWGALTQPEFATATKVLSQKIDQIRAMLDNLLYWSISQMGNLHPRQDTVAIAPIVRQQLESLQSAANSKGIRIVNCVSDGTALYVDANHLIIILRNLLQNALKFTELGGTIQIAYEERDGCSQLIITDTGIGIPREILASLFKLNGHPSRPGTVGESGVGLGLGLVLELVVTNGGRVAVTSEIGKGTTVTLTFSAEKAA